MEIKKATEVVTGGVPNGSQLAAINAQTKAELYRAQAEKYRSDAENE